MTLLEILTNYLQQFVLAIESLDEILNYRNDQPSIPEGKTNLSALDARHKRRFSGDEMFFMVNALQGVVCSPSTLLGNLEGHIPYGGEVVNRINPLVLLGKVAELEDTYVAELHGLLELFWDQTTAFNANDRLREVGLTDWIYEA
jgi:hypothetical protein